MTNKLFKLSQKAADMVLSTPKTTTIRVISHYDADGISAAGLLCTALYRQGYDFHASLMRNPFTQGLERVKQEENELIIFSDMGSGQIPVIEQFNCNVIILDHHQPIREKVREGVIQINANLCGIDGNFEAAGATISYSLAKALDSENDDLAALALTGAIGDKQYIGGLRGYNKSVLTNALEKDIVKKFTGIKLNGDTLFDSLYFSIDPYYPGISGDEKEIDNLLKKLHLERNTKIEAIDLQKMVRLNSVLLFKLIRGVCQKNILDTVIRERYWAKKLNCELERFADLLDACGKGGFRGLGLALCLNGKDMVKEALKIERDYRQRILRDLVQLEKEGVNEMEGIRYFYGSDSSLGGVVAGIAMNFILDREKPLFSLVHKDDELHVSCRGNQYLVGKGLDLGFVMKNVASSLEGTGGGHKIAAGATLLKTKEGAFLESVDALIVQQMKKGVT